MSTNTAHHRLTRWIPALSWLPHYRSAWLKGDLIAGLTVWALVVPQAIAYAQIAGLPPQAGVFASFAAPLAYALFGTSRQLIVSPTSATAAISASLVGGVVAASDLSAYASLSAALAILCGVAFLILGALKLGYVSQFIAPSVQTGFLIGLGLTIMVGQFCKVLGIASSDGPFYRQVGDLLHHLDDVHLPTLLLGGASLVVLFALSRFAPRWPAALIVVLGSLVSVVLFRLDQHGVEVVGAVDRAIPTPHLPRVGLHDLLTLVPGTLAIVVIGYSESMSVVRQFSEKHRYEIDPDQELVALGMSSIAGGLFQGFITGGGASQSAANDRAGARTQMAAIILALLAALSSIVLMPLFRHLPLAALGAIVIYAVSGFVDLAGMKRLFRLRKDSFTLAIVAFVGVVILGILPGLLLTIGISVLMVLGRIARPEATVLGRIPPSDIYVPVVTSPVVRPEPGLMVIRPTAPIVFANTPWLREAIGAQIANEAYPPWVLVLDLSASSDLDVAGLDLLRAVARDGQRAQRALWLSHVNQRVLDVLDRGAFATEYPTVRIFLTNELATRAFLDSVHRGPAPRDTQRSDRGIA